MYFCTPTYIPMYSYLYDSVMFTYALLHFSETLILSFQVLPAHTIVILLRDKFCYSMSILWGTATKHTTTLRNFFFLLCVSSGDGILNISVCFLKDYCFSQFSLKKFQRLQLTAIHIAFNLHILTTSPLSIIQSKKPCLQDRFGKKICNQQMSNWT